MSGPSEHASTRAERIPLHEDTPELSRRRLISGLVGTVLFAAAFGGIAGLIGGRGAGLLVAAIVGALLLYATTSNLRRKVWLEGATLVVRTWGVHRLALADAGRIDLVISDVRGVRTVSLLIRKAERRRAVKVDLALFAGGRARGLDILALRKLANALMNSIEANGIVFAELLVAELRAEARGDGLEGRPLYRLAAAAPSGKLAQRYSLESVSRFVASIE